MVDSIEYRYEKYGAIALSRWFRERGYEVQLSVPGPIKDIRTRTSLGGIDPPDLSEFDTDDPQTRYEIYYDSPGHIDLVACRDEDVWVIEAKGITKGRGAPGAVAEAFGQIALLIDPGLEDCLYGILLPMEDRFRQVVADVSDNNPLLSRSDFGIFWVTEEGEIKLDERFIAA